MKYTFSHLHFYCQDLETLVSFWKEGFGATEIGRRTIRNMPAVDMKFQDGLHIIVQKTDGILADATVRTGYNHIGFEVQNLEDELKRLTTLPGVALRDAPRDTPSHVVAFITGPEGVPVEIMQKK